MNGKRLFSLAYKGLLEEEQDFKLLKSYFPDEPLYDRKLREIQLEKNEVLKKLEIM
jgi:hypothetical protein